ncbi:Loss of heterozygosity 12 chromosomal region 1 protein [Strongyloides ratti]|uniref:BLOC-1-related complex subunit 5 n=1 Tax=Strongyloides ratti TaxID=34506 RepID=A0A090LCL3_STRRB|nr:Loss of heterozygosity 12 chromosomal region 1 protein [Strongyloides ratti]CEF67536.1 Loss of heterozygosity 12 chromosomal region 1 protein [Strongyloides ratti]
MGNEISGNNGTPSSSMSFFSSRSQSQPPGTSTMITVNRGGNNLMNPENDPDVIRLNEIPKFLPIMKGSVLNTSVPQRDIYRQINPKLLYDKFSELHIRMNENARFIQSGQNEIFGNIKKVDNAVKRITCELRLRENKYKKLDGEMLNLHSLQQTIDDIHRTIENLCENIKEINTCLNENQRLPPLDLNKGLRSTNDNENPLTKINPTFEHTVVDVVEKKEK